MGIPKILQTTERFLTSNSPLVLTVLGAAGVITTAVLTGKASFKAAELIAAENEERWGDGRPEMQLFHTKAKFVWKLYIPPLSVAAVTITAIVMANRIGTRRAAALATAYSLSEHAFGEYREKVKEKFTPKKEAELRDELAQDRADRIDPKRAEVLVAEGSKWPCLDEYSGRLFISSMEELKKAQNDTNYQILNHDYATLNEFYDRLGLDHLKFGDRIGWSASEKLELKITSVVLPDGRPALAFDFYVEPIEAFHPTH